MMSKARVAVYAGSFDPIHNGHLDIVQRCRKVFDETIVAVLGNQEKQPAFSTEERVEMIRGELTGWADCRVESFDGLLVDYMETVAARAIVRGLRAVSDFEYEFEMNQLNRKLAPDIESVYVMASPEYSFLSSTGVKELATFGGDVSDLVPTMVADQLAKRIQRP